MCYIMSALFLGELSYIYGRKELSGVKSIWIAALIFIIFRVIFRYRVMAYIWTMVLIGIYAFGYYHFGMKEQDISQISRSYNDRTQVSIGGRVYDVQEKSTVIYIYLDHAYVSGESDVEGSVADQSDDGNCLTNKKILVVIDREKYDTTCKMHGSRVYPGEYFYAKAMYHAYEIPRNEGGYDEKMYYYSLGISGKFEVDTYRCVTCHNGVIESIDNQLRKNLYRFRNRLKLQLIRLAGERYGGIYSGILLGDKSGLQTEIKELYQMSGISHILSISGLHISLIGYCVYGMMRRFKGIFISASCSILIMYLYGMMTGFGFSTRRAVIMLGIKIMADVVGRTYDISSSLAAGAIWLMADNPLCIYHSGLILSFTAILGICPLYQVLREYLGLDSQVPDEELLENEKNKNRGLKNKGIVNRGIAALILSECINMMTRPWVINAYNRLPLYAGIVNVIVVFLMPSVILLGGIGLIIGMCGNILCIWIGKRVIYTGCMILKLYEKLCALSLKLPGAVTIVGDIDWRRIAVYYLIVIIFVICMHIMNNRQKDSRCMESTRRLIVKPVIRFMTTAAMICSLFAILTYENYNGLQIKMIDVGQGDSIFIRSGNNNILIDCGSSSDKRLTKYTILPFLYANGVSQIDFLVATHSDSDHVNGMKELLTNQVNGKNYVRNLVLADVGGKIKDEAYLELERTALLHGVKVLYFSKGDRIMCGKTTVCCVWPERGADDMDKNALSLVLRLENGNFSAVFTGDLSGEAEQMLVEAWQEKGQDMTADVLKVGHHGSENSSSREFLEYLHPKAAMISCGENNPYGHPAKDTVQRIAKVGSDIFITKDSGQITVSVNPFGNGKSNTGKNSFYVESFLH